VDVEDFFAVGEADDGDFSLFVFAALGGGALSRNAVHCAKIVSNVSTSSCKP
jgi:hypothetical protein